MKTAAGESTVTSMEGVALREYLAMLDPYLMAAGVTELQVNRPGEVWTDGSQGWAKHDVPALTFNYCMQVAKLIANFDQQAVNAAHPSLSATLPGGLRVQVEIPPSVEAGTVVLAIRRPSTGTRPLEAYTADGAFSEYGWARPAALDERREELSRLDQRLVELLEGGDLEGFLRLAITGRKNIAVIGDTGSGKTTLMKSLIELVPASQRVISIEDVRELFITVPNRVHMLYSATGQGAAGQTAGDKIRSCMRLTPDRILVAELRGAEAFEFLDALTTGHSGSITSFHARDCAAVASRFDHMCRKHPASVNYSMEQIEKDFNDMVDVVLHMTCDRVLDENGETIAKKRYVTEVRFDPIARLQANVGNGRMVYPHRHVIELEDGEPA